jgi:hypothetical protein
MRFDEVQILQILVGSVGVEYISSVETNTSRISIRDLLSEFGIRAKHCTDFSPIVEVKMSSLAMNRPQHPSVHEQFVTPGDLFDERST